MNAIAIAPTRQAREALAPRVAAGALVWLTYLAIVRPNVMAIDWGRAVLLFAAVAIAPLVLRLLRFDGLREPLLIAATWLQLPAGALLACSLALEEGPRSIALAVPWLFVTLLLMAQGCERLAKRRGEVVLALAMIYSSVGGVWTLCDRAGWMPFGFDREIGLLTAIHFHYAGLALPLLSGLAARELQTQGSRITAWATVVAVPALAVGITAAHLGAPDVIETLAAAMMAGAAIATAWQYGQLAARPHTPYYSRLLWTVGALVLATAMLPAILYGARAYLPIAWLDIPLMRAVHGAANAFGFTLPALLGWHVKHACSRGL